MHRVALRCAAVGLAVVVAGTAMGCSGTSRPIEVGEAVVLVPSLNAGAAGWCLLTIRVASDHGGCGATQPAFPVIARKFYGGGPPPEAGGIVLTTSAVAAVSIGGSTPLKTRAYALLPPGVRAVVWKITGKGSESYREPHVVPLNTHGEAMRSSRSGPLFVTELPSRNVPAGVPASGACTIAARVRTGLSAGRESVVIHLHGIAGLLGEAFLACAKAEYQLNGWPINASLLVDAADPGLTPPPLPGSKTLAGLHGVSVAPGQEGPQVASRIRHGWLVVSGGQDQAQRVVLLEDLRARVTFR